MRDAVAEHFDCELPPPGAILELELTMDECRALIQWIGERFPSCKGTSFSGKPP